MSSSDSDMEEEQGPNEYDYNDGFIAPDDSADSADSDNEDRDVGEGDLQEEERAIYRRSLQQTQGGVRRSGRIRRTVERYQDPEYSRLMSDNGRDILPDDSDEGGEQDEEEYQPEQGDFSMDEASSADED